VSDPTWDHYFIPGTDVLRNNFVDAAHPHGITDKDTLASLEHDISMIKMVEILSQPTPPDTEFDLAYMKQIHARIFGPIYPFAGQIRTGPDATRVMRKIAPDVVDYAPGDPAAPMRDYYYRSITNLEPSAEHAYGLPKKFNYFLDAPRPNVVGALAATWGAVNQHHVFREGNTRSQFVYFTQLAERAGYDFEFARFAEDADLRAEFVDARYHHQSTGTAERLTAVIDKALTPITPDHPVDRGPSLGALLAATRPAKLARAAQQSPSLQPPHAAPPDLDLGRDTGRGVAD